MGGSALIKHNTLPLDSMRHSNTPHRAAGTVADTDDDADDDADDADAAAAAKPRQHLAGGH